MKNYQNILINLDDLAFMELIDCLYQFRGKSGKEKKRNYNKLYYRLRKYGITINELEQFEYECLY